MGTDILILLIIKKENLSIKCNVEIQFQFYVYTIYLKTHSKNNLQK